MPSPLPCIEWPYCHDPHTPAGVDLGVAGHFSDAEEEHLGQKFDAFLMCVDRHSGWMVARPTQYEGLTGVKAAHLLLDQCWGELGVPSIITSDQGPNF